jgi:hypothetical protein
MQNKVKQSQGNPRRFALPDIKTCGKGVEINTVGIGAKKDKLISGTQVRG